MLAIHGENAPSESALPDRGTAGGGWRVVFASVLGLAFGPSVILLMSFGMFAPAIEREFGWGVARISLGATIMALMLVVISPVQGYLVDRVGARRVVLCSLPLFAAGLIGLARLGPDIRIFYIVCVCLPILAIGLWPLSFNRIVSGWFDRRLGLALGATNSGMGIGATIVPIIVGAVLLHSDWRMAYTLLAVIVLVIVWPAAALFLREQVRTPRAVGPDHTSLIGLTVPEVVRQRSFWMLLAGFLGLGMISSGIVTHQIGILLDRGISANVAILFQSVLGISSIAGRIVAGWLLDRIHLSKLMSLILLTTFGASLIYVSAAPVPLLFLGSALFGFLIGAELDVLGYALRHYYGLLSFGRIWGFVYATFQVGGATGIFAPGLIREISGSYAPALLLIGAISLLVAAIFSRFPPYRYDREPEFADGSASGG